MTRGFDELIEHLLNEVALCGEEGTSIAELKSFIQRFYADDKVKVDPPLLKKIWQWLLSHSDISAEGADDPKLAFLDEATSASTNQPDAEGVHDQIQDDGSETFEPRVSAANDDPSGRSDDAKTGREQSAPVGSPSGIRITASKDRIWLALTGHTEDYRKVLPLEYELLEVIVRYREKGITQPELARLTGQDIRSVPKRTFSLAEKGYIVKETVAALKSRTSLLTHKRFAKQKEAVVSDPKAVFVNGNLILSKLWEFMFGLFEKQQYIGQVDLRRKFGVDGNRNAYRKIWRAQRHMIKLGLVDLVRAKWTFEGREMPKTIVCFKLLRRPTPADRDAFLQWRKQEEISRIREVANDSDDDSSDGEREIKEVEVGNEPVADVVAGLDVDLEDDGDVDQLVPQWTATRPLPNFLFDVIDNAGKEGLNSAQLGRRSVGIHYHRPLEETMSRLTDAWEKSQPQHLRHFSIVRDTKAYSSRGVQYVYRSLAGHQAAVTAGESSWEGISKTAAKSAGMLLKASELDEWGFPQPRSSNFVDPSASPSMSKCFEAAKIKIEYPSAEATIAKRHDGTEYVLWPAPDEGSEAEGEYGTPRKSRAPFRPGRKGGQGMFGAGVRTDSLEYQKLWREKQKDAKLDAIWQARARELAKWRAFRDTLHDGVSSSVAEDITIVPPPKARGRPRRVTTAKRPRGRPRKDEVEEDAIRRRAETEQRTEETESPSADGGDVVAVPKARTVSEACIAKHLGDILSLRTPGAYCDPPGSRRRNLPPYTPTVIVVVKSQRLQELDWTPRWVGVDVPLAENERTNDGVEDGALNTQALPGELLLGVAETESSPRVPSTEAIPDPLDNLTQDTNESPHHDHSESRLAEKSETNPGVPDEGSITGESNGKATPVPPLALPRSEATLPQAEITAHDVELQVDLQPAETVEQVAEPFDHAEAMEVDPLENPRILTENLDPPLSNNHLAPSTTPAFAVSLSGPPEAAKSAQLASLVLVVHSSRLAEVSPKPTTMETESLLSDNRASYPVDAVPATSMPALDNALRHTDTAGVLPNEQPDPSANSDQEVRVLPFVVDDAYSDNVALQDAKTPKGKSRPRQGVLLGGGSVARVRSSILHDMLERCGGLMPGGRDIVQPFAAAFQARIADAPVPDKETIQRAIKNLRDQGTIKYITFQIRMRNGPMFKKVILATKAFNPKSPAVDELMKKIQAAHPHAYLPEAIWEPGTAPQARSRMARVGQDSLPVVTAEDLNVAVPVLHIPKQQLDKARKQAESAEKKQAKAAGKAAAMAAQEQRKAEKELKRKRKAEDKQVERELRYMENEANGRKRRRRRRASNPDDLVDYQLPGFLTMTAQSNVASVNSVEGRSLRDLLPMTEPDISDAGDEADSPGSTPTVNPMSSGYVHNPHAQTYTQAQTLAQRDTSPPMIQDQSLVHSAGGFPVSAPNTIHASTSRVVDGLAPRPAEMPREGVAGYTASPQSLPAVRRVEKRRQYTESDRDETYNGTPERGSKRRKASGTPTSSLVNGRTPVKASNEMTMDQVLKLLHAHTAVRALASGLDGAASWNMINHIFRHDPTYSKQIFSSKYNSISKGRNNVLEGMLSDFQVSFLAAYEAGEIPAIDYGRMEEIDWDAIVAWSMRTLSISTGSIPTLPETQAELGHLYFTDQLPVYYGKERARFLVKHNLVELERAELLHETPLQLLTSGADAMVGLSMTLRDADVMARLSRLDYGPALTDAEQAFMAMSTADLPLALMFAMSAVRADTFTPEDVYKLSEPQASLEAMPAGLRRDATETLESIRVIAKKRNDAERSHAISEFFEAAVRGHCAIEPADLDAAVAFKKRFDEVLRGGSKSVPFKEDVDDGMNLAVTNLTASGRIRMAATMPPFDDTIEASGLRISKWGWNPGEYKGVRNDTVTTDMIKLRVEPTETYESGVPAANNKDGIFPTLPPKPPAIGPLRLYPLWVDIHGDLILDWWRKLVCYTLQTIHLRPYIGTVELTEGLKGLIWQWEIELVLEWAESNGLVFAVENGHQRMAEKSWRTAEYWWLCLAKGDDLAGVVASAVSDGDAPMIDG